VKPQNKQLWQYATKTGRPQDYKPDELWDTAVEYFKWCQDNPWIKHEAIKGGDRAGEMIEIPTSRPFTLKAFCLFADIAFQTFERYSHREEFSDITTRIRETCYSQKFEGAAVGAFNANIIARDLGLKDMSEIDIKANRKQLGDLFTLDAEPGNKES